MASVTQKIPNFLGGVSNQPDDKKLPGQVREAVNAYPDPTFGLTKRPGFKFIAQLADGVPSGGTAYDNTDLDNAKWFYINRDADEKYVGCIVGNSTANNAAIHIWNTVADSGVYKKSTITYGTNTKNYLTAVNAHDYDFLNVRDTSIITNKTKTVGTVAGSTFNGNRVATIQISLVEYSGTYEVKVKNTTADPDVDYVCTLKTRSGDTAANDQAIVNNQSDPFLSADFIIDSLVNGTDAGSSGDAYSGHTGGLNGIPNVTAEVIGTTIELTSTVDIQVTASGGRTGTSLSVYQDEVDGITELSGETKHNRVVKIKNTFSASATYYAKFIAQNSTSGPGVWEETIGPGLSPGLDSSTMPHRLRNTGLNAFTFEVIEDAGGQAGVFGTPRLVGDDTTNSHPSFNGATIQQAFYYNNRIGFLTQDNVSMGQSGDYFNLYSQTAQTAIDSDPIDLSCSSIKEATLHGIVPSASGLLLFSQNQQFIMYSADGNLSPQTALIRGLSNYQMDSNIDPVDVGTHVNFVSKTHSTAGFTRVFAMLPQGIGQIPKVVDIGRVVSEYIPATIDSLTASPQNSFIAMYGKTADKVYFYRTYSDGDKDLIQCWFNWQAPGNVHFVEVDSDTMYSVVKTGSGGAARYNLLSATLTQTPEETIIVTSTGQQVNPHMDFYVKASSVAYDSANDLSKCYLPYGDVSALDPVIIIAGDVANFSGATESGFTVEPSRGTDGTGDYFSVPRKDLTSQAANVYVGYKYSYDITLPKMYFKQGQDGVTSDYTANLTVARMKFSVGQSSVVGFKLKSKGFKGSTQTFTGDGSTTQFKPIFKVDDINDIIVKKNGAIQTKGTDYTITNDPLTITFSSAPSAAASSANVTTPADSVEIYIDIWYTLMPTQEANYYLGNDVPLDTQSLFTVPIHQRTDNYTLRVYSDSPFPVALTSAAWEGTYSPRYYRRI